MVKRLLSFLISLVVVAPAAFADGETVYHDQSEIVTVVNAVDENGNYITGWSEDGYPTVTFRFTVPADVKEFQRFAQYSTHKNAWKNYYNFYHEAKYSKNLQTGLAKTVVSVEGVDYTWSFTGSGEDVSEGDTKAYNFTLTLKDVKNRNYSILKGDFSVRFDTLAVINKEDGTNKSFYAKYAPATYKFVAGDNAPVKVLSGDVASSSLADFNEANSLYVTSGSTFTVDGNFTCNNVYVEAADETNANSIPAGIVVNEGATLTADTLYFLSNIEEERAVGYIINNGTCTAAAAFIKNAKNNRDFEVGYAKAYAYTNTSGSAIGSWSYSLPSFCSPVAAKGDIDTQHHIFDDDMKTYTTGLWSPFISGTKYYGLANITSWDDYNATAASIPYYIMHVYTASKSLRVTGELNNEDYYTRPVTNVAVSDNQQTFVGNPYPAPIDWRSVTDAAIAANGDSSFAYAIRDVQMSTYSSSTPSIYNLATGLTTYDAAGKMYYGYLQPNMTNVGLFYQTGDLDAVSVAKTDLSSYSQADKTYAEKDYTNGLPYVRLYVDDSDATLAKGAGRRSVVALYFVPEELYNDLHSTSCEAYDATYDVNNIYESLAETHYETEGFNSFGGGWLFPYVGAYGVNQTSGAVATAIKMVAIPESGINKATSTTVEKVLSDFIRISVEKKKTEGGVEFGILDSDLKDSKIGIKVGGLSLNYPNEADVKSTTIDMSGYTDGETTKNFASNKVYSEWLCKQLSLDLTVSNVEDATSIDDVDVKSSISAGRGVVTVKAAAAGILKVYDLLGRLVAEQSVDEGSTSVAVATGAYVVSFSAGDSSCVNRVVVK